MIALLGSTVLAVVCTLGLLVIACLVVEGHRAGVRRVQRAAAPRKRRVVSPDDPIEYHSTPGWLEAELRRRGGGWQ